MAIGIRKPVRGRLCRFSVPLLLDPLSRRRRHTDRTHRRDGGTSWPVPWPRHNGCTRQWRVPAWFPERGFLGAHPRSAWLWCRSACPRCFNLLLRLHGWSPQSASHNGIIRESLRTTRFAGSASSSLGHFRRCLGCQRPSPIDRILFSVLKIEHEPNKCDDDRYSCYKLVKTRSMTIGSGLKQSLSNLVAPYPVYLVGYRTKKACSS